MENGTGGTRNLVLAELTLVKDLIRQLEAHLNQPDSKALAQRMFSSIQKTILLVKSSSLESSGQPAGPNAGTDSPQSTSASTHSEASERVFKDHEHRETSKKSKSQEKWSCRVRVAPGAGLEVPRDDGYNWRKYGQKDILGAKHPRGYYRCSRRNSHGCQATKHVQRSDEDLSVFDVTYYRTHTCVQMPQKAQESHLQKQSMQQNQPDSKNHNENLQHHEDQQLLHYFQAGPLVKTEGMDLAQYQASPSFSFPSTPVSCTKATNEIFPFPSMHDNCYMSCPPACTPPTTSEWDRTLLPPYEMSNYSQGLNLQASLLDHNTIIPPTTSATNSPMVDMDFELGFPFDSCGLL